MTRKPDAPEPDPAALPPAQAWRLETLVDFGKGSIVSRTLAKNAAGTLTLFAFDKGQGLSEHTAPFNALVQVLAGKLKLTIGGKPVPAEAGESVLMPAGVPHTLHAPERAKMLLTMLRG